MVILFCTTLKPDIVTMAKCQKKPHDQLDSTSIPGLHPAERLSLQLKKPTHALSSGGRNLALPKCMT